jgi:hypothetical protein
LRGHLAGQRLEHRIGGGGHDRILIASCQCAGG